MIQCGAWFFVFSVKAGIHVGHGHRPSPVWQEFSQCQQEEFHVIYESREWV
jgi:hypothetical protein